jgi:hypothetical protein
VSSDRLARPVFGDVAFVGCALTERSVGPVGVVVLDVLVEESFEMRAVPDERMGVDYSSGRVDLVFRESIPESPR